MSKVRFVFLACLVSLLTQVSLAADVQWTSRMEGASIDGGQLILEDGDFSDVLLSQFTDVEQFAYIRLGLADEAAMEFRGTRTISVDIDVIPYSTSNVALTTIPITLTVEYSHDGVLGTTVDGADYRLDGVYKFKMNVTGFTILDGTGTPVSETIPDYVYLEGGLHAERYYLFDTVTVPTLSNQMIQYSSAGVPSAAGGTSNTTIAATDEIYISWNYIDGAEYYDLEWTWVDNYSASSLSSVLATSAISMTEKEFSHNSTRIRTSDFFYRLPQTFGRGYLIYRVRAVGRWQSSPMTDLYGAWSSTTSTKNMVSDWPHVITIAFEHEASKNWQYQATYAEDGKKKEVSQYFDGSLRGRQTVTRINSDNHSVVGETIYDNEGRGVIQILPVPQTNPAIQFYAELNLNPDLEPYSHLNFDWEDNTTTTCSPSVSDPLSDTKGAGLYYSAAGHTGDTDWQQYVPESNGFAYTQVEYTPDNTGRVRSQSGVGDAHTIGSNHETMYYYSQPSQEELNRLFGYKVGYMSRYKKNMVVDANGQVSVSYLDAQGRVIATALAGNNNTDFESLYSEENGNHGIVYTDLLNKENTTVVDTPDDNNDLISTGNYGNLFDGLEFSTQLDVVEDDSEYNFFYDIESLYYTESCGGEEGIKLPYVYDVTLSLTNDCGEEFMQQTYTQIVGDALLNSTVSEDLAIVENAVPLLKRGTYTLTKRLTINQEFLEDYLEDYLDSAQNPCLLDDSEFLSPISTDCGITCDECVEALGGLSDFLQQAALNEGAPLDAGQITEYTETYNTLKENCLAPCQPATPCESYLGMMRFDVTPNGQYGIAESSAALSVYNTSSALSGHWRSSGITYVDANGNPALVQAYPNGNTFNGGTNDEYDLADSGNGAAEMVEPWELSLESFVTAFQPSWADALVPFHPEYPIYEYAEAICTTPATITTSGGSIDLSSDEFDDILRNGINTLELANNGTGGNPYGIDFVVTDAIYDVDPYFNLTYTEHGSLSGLKDGLMTEALADYNNSGMSMLQSAVKLAVYPNNYTITYLSTPITNVTGWSYITISNYTQPQLDQIWQNYKVLYLSKKAEINQYLMDVYGLNEGMFNGCIGSDDFSLGVIGNFGGSTYQNTMFQYFADAMFGTGTPFSLCGSEYDGKAIRMVRVGGLQNPGTPISAQVTQGNATADYAQWQQTGLCPLTIDMERLLNRLGTDNLLNSVSYMSDINEMVPDLYTAITSASISATSQLEMTGSIVSTELQLDFVVSSSSVCKVNIPQIDASLPWSSYATGGSPWYIFGIYNSYPTGSGNDISVVILAGADPTSAEEYVVTYSNTCADLNACQASYLANTQNDPNCTREEDFENAMATLMRALIENSEYTSTGVNLTTYPEYMNSVLPSYFAASPTWNGSTGTISFSGGSFQIGFTPSASTIIFGSYDIVGGTVYANYVNGPSTSVTSVNTSASYTATNITLDFNCTCVEMINDQAAAYQQSDAETAFLNLMNYVLNNPSLSNGTTSAEIDAFAPYTPCHISQSAIYNLTVSSSSISFGLADISSPPVSGSGPCAFSFSFSGPIIQFTDVSIEMNTESAGFVLTGLNNEDSKVVITAYSEGQEIAMVCDACADPLLLAPISCTDEYADLDNFMTTTFSSELTDTDDFMDEVGVFDAEYIGTQEDFCNYSYAYIEDAYEYYITQMGITSINDPQFLTIGAFGTTGIGYHNANLEDAVDDYKNSLSTSPYYAVTTSTDYLEWNDFVAEIYLKENPVCPPIMPTPVFPDTVFEYECDAWVNNVNLVNAQNQYGIYIDQISQAFIQAYIEGAMGTVVENFTENHVDKEYHYTLYYYDRAGNLIQTVPPKGVERFEYSYDGSGVETPIIGGTNDAINAERSSSPNSTANGTLAPAHTYNTIYRYNSLNQLVYQATPDGGESRFAYDALGRLVMSQNAKQKNATTQQFSYTRYDELGRVAEVGEMTLAGYSINDLGRLVNGSNIEATEVNSLAFPGNLSPSGREEVTQTIYDELANYTGAAVTVPVTTNPMTLTTTDTDIEDFFGATYASDNTRNRIVGVVYQEAWSVDVNDYNNASFYDYDVHGNVKQLLQVNRDADLQNLNQHVKRFDYVYDLVSGNVDQVIYQKDEPDQFIHRYHYDDDNRIIAAETSEDGFKFEQDAKYFYYDHGPLARTEIADAKVQATDYAYTIQGWIKTVNGEEVNKNLMMGLDAKSGTLHENIGADVFGYSLSYFDDDYESANTAMLAHSGTLSVGASLYNGNIRSMLTAISDYSEAALGTHHTKYGYDQLNRIKSMDGYNITSGSVSSASGYNSEYSFDANGNLETLKRYAWNGSSSVLMDNFVYNYDETTSFGGTNNNQLSWVDDQAGTSAFSDADIDNSMNSGNYDYDEIGQLLADADEGITEIEWKVTNKVQKVSIDTDGAGGADKFIEFEYDAMGNRIVKRVTTASDVTTTYYVLDAQGNQMAIYTQIFESDLVHTERSLFGSSRLGMENVTDQSGSSGLVMTYDSDPLTAPTLASNYYISVFKGDKRFEMSNHLGNVLEVITDRKLPVAESYFGSFDGVNDQAISSAFNAGLTTDVTVEAWVRTTPSGVNQVVASHYIAGSGVNKGVNLFVLSDGKANFGGRSGGSTTIYSGSSTTVVDDGEWHHLAGTCDGTVWSVYVDGVLENSYTASSAGTFSGLNTPFRVGANAYSTWFDGDIKEVSFWSVEKTQTELQADMYTEFSGSETGLKGYWSFADNTNPTDDISTGNHNLTLQNGAYFGIDNEVDYFTADVISYSDYYPYGMLMPNRNATAGDGYRYGFNGMEADDEIKNSKGTSYDFGARLYDPRMGRFFDRDRFESKFSYQSPYLYAGNRPISSIDKNGDSVFLMIWTSHIGVGHAAIAVQNYREVQVSLILSDGEIISTTFMSPDGTYTYYDLWPGGEGADFSTKDDALTVVEASYQNKTRLVDGTIIHKDDLLNGDPSESEGYAPEGIIKLYSDFEEDFELKQKLEDYIKSNTMYSAVDNSCSSFAKFGVQQILQGSNRPGFGMESFMGYKFATPNELYKDVVGLLIEVDIDWDFSNPMDYENIITVNKFEVHGEVIRDAGNKANNPFISPSRQSQAPKSSTSVD